MSLQTTGSLVKQSSTDWKAAWVCEMVGKNKRDARQERGICRSIKALHACWLVPYPTVHSSGAVCKTLRSSANKNLEELGSPRAASITLEEHHLNPSSVSCLVSPVCMCLRSR